MGGFEVMLSLRIRHPQIDPAEITRILGIQPQDDWRAGDLRQDFAGDEIGTLHAESYWMGRLLSEPMVARDQLTVESQLIHTLGTLRRCFGFLERLKAEGGSAELLVSLYSVEELRLKFLPDLLMLLGRAGLALVIDVKPNPVLN
jgi:hypothetical protein